MEPTPVFQVPATPEMPVVPVVPGPPTTATRRTRLVIMRPGHLVAGWGTLYWLGWLIIGAAFGAVWYSSRVTGLSTWWLGPKTEPRIWFHVVPFIAPFSLSFLALRFTRHLPWLGLLGAAVCAGIAAGDLADQPRYAAIEFALAVAGALISLASFAGMLRAAPAAD